MHLLWSHFAILEVLFTNQLNGKRENQNVSTYLKSNTRIPPQNVPSINEKVILLFSIVAVTEEFSFRLTNVSPDIVENENGKSSFFLFHPYIRKP